MRTVEGFKETVSNFIDYARNREPGTSVYIDEWTFSVRLDSIIIFNSKYTERLVLTQHTTSADIIRDSELLQKEISRLRRLERKQQIENLLA